MSLRPHFQIAAVLLGCCLALALLFWPSGSSVLGQTPTPTPTPAAPTVTPAPPLVAADPSWFRGSVTINGLSAPNGTLIEAMIRDIVCGSTKTDGDQYQVSVNAGYGVGAFQEGCGGSGPNTSAVVFRSGSLIANEQAAFVAGGIQDLDLTFGQAPDLPIAGVGSSPASGPTIPWFFWALLAGGAVALTAAAAATAARSRA